MAKCIINSDNEVLAIWEDDSLAPEDSVPCDRLPDPSTIADGPIGEPVNHHYTLVSGKLVITEAGTAYQRKQYARDREAEYPTIAELTVALYDTDDKSAVEAKRAAVKLKYPKPE